MIIEETEQGRHGPTGGAPRSDHRLAMITIAAGVLGVACAAAVLLTPPQVPSGRFSYPFDTPWFVTMQLTFAIQHLGMIAGVLGVAALVPVPNRGWRVATVMAGGGLILLIGCELFGLLAATAANDSGIATAASAAYGLPTVLVGLGFLMAGWKIGRLRLLSWGRWLPFAVGLWVFVVLLPALMGPDIAGTLAIGGWMALYALLGVALWRSRRS